MAWARIDDGILDHPKMLRAGEDASSLFLRSVIWCNKHTTDGVVPKEALRVLTSKPAADEMVASLIKVKLWVDRGDHWEIHDFGDWNPTRESVKNRRAEAAERQRRSREKRALAKAHEAAKDASPVTRDKGSDKRVSHSAHSTPLHSFITTEDPPVVPRPSGPAVTAKAPPKRKAPSRPESPEVEAVRSEVKKLVGVDYPPAAWDGLRARLRDGTSGDDALVFVRWAAQQPWEGDQVKLDPTVLFRAERFAAGLAKAKAGGGTSRPRQPPRLVGGIPHGPPVTPQNPEYQERRCRECFEYVMQRMTDDGWIPDPHKCSAAAGGTR